MESMLLDVVLALFYVPSSLQYFSMFVYLILRRIE